MIVLSRVGDGGGKICGRRIEHVRNIEPYNAPAEPRFVVGMCAKHGFVAITRSRFDRAAAAGQTTVHLARGRGTPREGLDEFREDMFVAGMLEFLARRSPEALEIVLDIGSPASGRVSWSRDPR